MKFWFATAVLLVFTFVGLARGELQVTNLGTTALDAKGKPELHLRLTGIKAPTKRLRIQTDQAVYDIPWGWKDSSAEVWIAVGEWKKLVLQLTYVDGTVASVALSSLAKERLKK